MLLRSLAVLFSIPIAFLVLHTMIRIVRAVHKFPMPQWMANLIDNPLRRKIQPPDETAERHGVEAGMRVLEIGPGNGTYTLGIARKACPEGEVIAVDIEPRMIARLEKRVMEEGATNIQGEVANVYDLPFEPGSFDLVTMIAVLNEIPDIPKALQEFHRVLKPNGRLVTSELFLDPDYALAGRLIRKIEAQHFRLEKKLGNFFYYTLIFTKIS